MNHDNGRHGARHPIRVVARRTGLKADLIRAWERRYGAISPERSAGRHRFYSDADIERLLLLRQATASGRTIGQVAHLADPELRALVDEDRQLDAVAPPSVTLDAMHEAQLPAAVGSAKAADDGVDLAGYLDPIRRLDARGLRHRLERSAVEMGYSRALGSVVVPLMRWLDRSESDHQLRAMHAHLASFEIRAFVEDLIRRAPADPRAPRLLVATPADRSSESGALLMAATATFEGWDVTYLGSELPADEIVLAAHAMAAEAVAVQLTEAGPSPSLGGDLTMLRRRLRELPILVGGRAAGYADALRSSPEMARTLSVHDLGELRTMLTQLRAQSARPSAVDTGSPRSTPSAVASDAVAEGALPSRPLGHRALPLSRDAFERFELDPSLLTAHGQLHVGDLQSVRRLVHRLEQSPVLREHPERGLRAGRLHGFALLYEVAGEALRQYRTQRNPGVWRRALASLRQDLGDARLDATLRTFGARFPASREAWSSAAPREDTPEAQIERLFLVSWLHRNPAVSTLRQLFDDPALAASSDYPRVVAGLERCLREETPVATEGGSLVDQVLAAQEQAPDSLAGQLEAWLGQGLELAPNLVDRLWMGIDVLREEEAPPYDDSAPSPAPRAIAFSASEGSSWQRRDEPAWMHELVLVAKNVQVWLAQLSERFGRPIQRLDEIPAEALDELVAHGFTGLWLIGIWQRSRASRRIKELAGRRGIVASAYAIDDYVIADALGGDPAREALAALATERGLRLACDMVPNHMGLDSRWVIEHPEYFVSVAERPFPSYTFGGEDLSTDDRVSLYLEDHYFDQSDAAVVFQRIDRQSGEISFVYHGNDGTRLPWNDTAQLDVTRAEVREALITVLLDLARQFPVIRLDAAMTLMREHFQRLWYPEPGTGGAIPSRAGFHTPREVFEQLMPRELWREVVERIEREVPGTLLLAEGFWFTEDTFIRDLGMHRVYNSAFFHLLRDRDHAEFRATLESALAFDPAVLECFTNFLTTPDEAPAAESFGKGDRYFAVCVLLATLPGLPLFGHGQVEGAIEYYAMDAAAPRYSEAPDAAFLERHRREILPLLSRRADFADGRRFRLFPVEAMDRSGDLGAVYAYVTGPADRPVLVVVHNDDSEARGWLRRSVPFRDGGDVRQIDIAEALGASPKAHADRYCIFYEHRVGRWFVRPSRQIAEDGFAIAVGAWDYRIIDQIREVVDTDGRYRALATAAEGVAEAP